MTELMQCLGWALLQSVWQGALVWLMFALSMRMLAASCAEVRYGIALAWLTIILMLPAASFLRSFDALPAVAIDVASMQWIPITHVALALQLPAILPWLAAFWLAGVALMGLRLGLNWRRVGQLVQNGLQPVGAAWEDRVARLRETLGVSRPVCVFRSVLVSVPTVAGWLRPVILLPPGVLLGLGPRQLELILAHELAHIRRHDYLANLFQVLVETVLFFHPAVHAISRRVRIERELCCDELVVSRCGAPRDYARALTAVETMRRQSPELGLRSFSATGGELVTRIRCLVSGSEPLRAQPLMTFSVVVSMVLVLGSVLLPGERQIAGLLHLGATADVAAPPDAVAPGADAAVMDRPAVNAVVSVAPDRPDSAALPTGPVPRFAMIPVLVAPRRAPNEIAPPVLAKPDVHGLRASSDRAIAEVLETMAHRPPGLPDAAAVVAVSRETGSGGGKLLARAAPPYRVLPPKVAPVSLAANTGGGGHDRESVETLRVIAVEEGGDLIKHIVPRYPRRLRMRGYEETVHVEFLVSDRGDVTDVEVINAEARPAFKRAVVSAVSLWRFEPLLRDGVAVPRKLTETFAFTLDASRPMSERTVCSARSRINGCAIAVAPVSLL